MTVREIVEEYLKAHGYGGLCNGYLGCGCVVGDLMPCEMDTQHDCEPGYIHYCENCALVKDGCDSDARQEDSDSAYCVTDTKEIP
jgi:hypothetical protein